MAQKSFVLKLAEILELDLANEPKEAKVYNDELKKYENMYIYIGTNFKCTAQSIFVLTFLQGTRYVKIPDKSVFCFKGLKEYLKILSDIVRGSYKKEPILHIFGDVTGHKLHLLDKNYFFNTSGELIDQEINEQVATIGF